MNIKELAIKHGLSQHLQLEKTSITDKLEAYTKAVIEAFVSEQKCEPVGVFNREIYNSHGAFRYEVHQGEPLKFGDKLYTTPQPREWVGLSDSELINLAVEDEFLLLCDEDEFIQIARAVEAKLKELNK